MMYPGYLPCNPGCMLDTPFLGVYISLGYLVGWKGKPNPVMFRLRNSRPLVALYCRSAPATSTVVVMLVVVLVVGKASPKSTTLQGGHCMTGGKGRGWVAG